MYKHETVLLNELVEALNLSAGDFAIDCTVGGGGHTQKLLEAVYTTGTVLGIDRDYTAIGAAEAKFASALLPKGNLALVHAAFSQIKYVIRGMNAEGKVAGIAADLGVSSIHFDQSERGFSIRHDGPLDMRMDQTNPQIKTAADLLRDLDQQALADIFRAYGEEPKAWAIAKSIVEARAIKPLTTTHELATLVAKHWNDSRKHPATRVFQALRIAVNEEVKELETLLADGFDQLKVGGRMAIISFHSLEDRLVKQFCQKLAGKMQTDTHLLRHLPQTETTIARAKIIKPFPLIPTEQEIEANPRSRSAKLRVIEKT